jgi:predicted nucleic acid-binding Zn ribbon protein
MNIPAETRVAECIKDEAGTGASIESGSQICGPICADLIKQQFNRKKHIISTKLMLKFKIFKLNML